MENGVTCALRLERISVFERDTQTLITVQAIKLSHNLLEYILIGEISSIRSGGIYQNHSLSIVLKLDPIDRLCPRRKASANNVTVITRNSFDELNVG